MLSSSMDLLKAVYTQDMDHLQEAISMDIITITTSITDMVRDLAAEAVESIRMVAIKHR